MGARNPSVNGPVYEDLTSRPLTNDMALEI
jgi:hypothetical protein